MKQPTLTEIRKSVESNGGTYAKCSFKLYGEAAYKVNGKLYTAGELKVAYSMGDL